MKTEVSGWSSNTNSKHGSKEKNNFNPTPAVSVMKRIFSFNAYISTE